MTQEMMIMAAILVAVILLTFIGILSRYRKCKSDEVLVYMVRPAMIRSRRNCIMVALLLFGLLYRAMNSCL